MAENVVSWSSNGIKVNKHSKSLGRQCVAYGCYQTFYKPGGSKIGIHFFKFPRKNPQKNLWWTGWQGRLQGFKQHIHLSTSL